MKTVAEVKPWFLRDSPGFQLVPELEPLSSEVIFDKITMSAFEGTPLDIALRDCGINSFIIAGVASEIGIEPTIRHGSDLGYANNLAAVQGLAKKAIALGIEIIAGVVVTGFRSANRSGAIAARNLPAGSVASRRTAFLCSIAFAITCT